MARASGLAQQIVPNCATARVNLYGLKQCFEIAGKKKDKTPFELMLDDMIAQMIQNIIKEEYMAKMHRDEAAERSLYESRKNIWDAEKRLKAANHAIDHKISQRGGRRVTSSMQDIYEADKAAYKTDSKQYE